MKKIKRLLKTLKNIQHHTNMLRDIPALFAEFSTLDDLFVHAHMTFFFTQYLAEEIGIFISQQQNDDMYGHPLENYRVLFNMGSSLPEEAIKALDVEKGSEILYAYFLKTRSASPLMHTLNGILGTSLIARYRKEGKTFPEDHVKELSLSEMQDEVVEFMVRLGNISIELIQRHVLHVG